MQICVCGWYFNLDLLAVLSQFHVRYDATIVSHNPIGGLDLHEDTGIPVIEVDNIGLEFGAYDYFLKNLWDRKSGVLFMHDDVSIDSPEYVFETIDNCGYDQVFVFHDEADGKANQNFHGRMFYCSSAFLHQIIGYLCMCKQAEDHEDVHHNLGTILKGTGPHTGFWFDPNNEGHVSGKPPIGIRHYNDAIYHFALQCKRAASQYGLSSDMKLYFPSINLHKRGIKK